MKKPIFLLIVMALIALAVTACGKESDMEGTSSDGGITADYSAASSLDLVSDSLVEIKGAYEGNSFVAQKVTIYSFNE